jgi:hypothetical protein
MEMRDLLEKMMNFAGEKTGQKPGDQWRGDDPNPPGKKLVGDSMLKDLSKGPKTKSKEQELAEEWATFSEENIGTHPKRPRRTSDRHSRGHEPQARYITVKAEEAANPAQQAAIAIAMKKAGKKSKNEQEELNQPRRPEVIDDLPKTPQDPNKGTVVKDYNRLPKDPNTPQKYPTVTDEDVAYKTANPHPASKDPIVAKVVKQMRPGLKNLDMGNEAFLYFAYELGKQRARDAWSDYLPAIRAEYEKGLNEDANTDNKLAKLLARFVNQSEGADRAVALDAIEYIKKIGHIEQFATSLDYFGVDLDEGSKEDGPVEARWMVKVSDDEGDHLKTYHRKFPSLSAAKKAYKNTPYATDFKHKSVKKDQVEEAIDSDIVQAMGQDSFNRGGFNPLRDERDYLDTLSKLSNLSRKQGLSKEMKDHIEQRILDLNAEARKKGFTQVESRGHTIIANKLKDVERAKKFASGELKVPSPQERQAQLKQLEKAKPVKEYGANNVSPYGQPTAQNVDPNQAQQVAANLNTQKTALTQLKQINPEIDPLKAATAATKDVATMSPQEKEELAQVAKTLSPALGTSALGSIKTALQKSKNN